MLLADEQRIDGSAYGTQVLDAELTSGIEMALGRLALCSLLNRSGEEFLRGALEMIDAAVRPRMLFIAERLDPFDDAVATMLALAGGAQVPNFRVPLSVSPCGRVLDPCQLCVYRRDVASLFPHCVQLEQVHAEGFIGMPLVSTHGHAIGLVAAITRDPLRDVDGPRRLLLLFGTRMTLEVERRRAGSGDEAARMRAAIAREEHDLREALRMTVGC
jgi:hypothetical protein